ncbi:hypothetical protein A2U01_0116565, partial [Trifolium medium]|nr:hypothetical protein [Trifolium medium]
VAQRASQRAVGLPVAFSRWSKRSSDVGHFLSLKRRTFRFVGRYLSLVLAQRA